MSLPRLVVFLLVSVISVVVFHATSGLAPDQVGLIVGSIHLPPSPTMAWYALWQVFATIFAIALGIVLYGVGERVRERVSRAMPADDDEQAQERAFILLVSLTAFAIPWVLRFAVLNDLPIADDEAGYLF